MKQNKNSPSNDWTLFLYIPLLAVLDNFLKVVLMKKRKDWTVKKLKNWNFIGMYFNVNFFIVVSWYEACFCRFSIDLCGKKRIYRICYGTILRQIKWKIKKQKKTKGCFLVILAESNYFFLKLPFIGCWKAHLFMVKYNRMLQHRNFSQSNVGFKDNLVKRAQVLKKSFSRKKRLFRNIGNDVWIRPYFSSLK